MKCQLQYRKRRCDKCSWVMFCLIVFATSSSVWGQSFRTKAYIWWLALQCSSYKPPEDFVVFQGDMEYLLTETPDGFSEIPTSPLMRQKLLFRPILAWSSLLTTVAGRSQTGAVLFLHQRTALGGEPRLVVVGWRPMPKQPRLTATVIPIYKVDDATELAKFVKIDDSDPDAEHIHFLLEPGHIADSGGVKCFAGDPDPADPSHFAIRLKSYGVDAIIDGWLLPTDEIKLKLRDATTVRTQLKARVEELLKKK